MMVTHGASLVYGASDAMASTVRHLGFDAGALGVGIGATALLFAAAGSWPVWRRRPDMGGPQRECRSRRGSSSKRIRRSYQRAPSIAQPHVTNFGVYPSVGTPVGLNLHIQKGAFLRLEYQASWEQLQRYNLRHHLGAGFAVQW